MKSIVPVCLAMALVFSSCDERPKDVMSEGKMEDVLYDYHLMQGMIDQLPSEDKENKALDYINAVYQKHNISHADLERSLVYYNRHQKQLNTIYTKVRDRLTEENEQLQLLNGSSDMMAVFAAGGDTTNLWNSSPVVVLRNKSLLNKESFTVKADTSFHKNDKYILVTEPYIIGEDKDDYRVHVDFGLSVMYASGKHIGITRSVRSGGSQQISLDAIDDDAIKSVSGFFYFNGKKGSRTFCVLDNIQLIRMHEKEAEQEVKADSVKADSAKTDTAPNKMPEQRLTPEQMRQMNKSNKQIDIQEAPTIRHANSIGPRRRNMQRK